jgi:hypothetical protein
VTTTRDAAYSIRRYDDRVIRDREAYRRLVEEEHWRRLEAMSIEESIAIGEALLTSEAMDIAEFPDDDRPLSLAKALGLSALDGPLPPRNPSV